MGTWLLSSIPGFVVPSPCQFRGSRCKRNSRSRRSMVRALIANSLARSLGDRRSTPSASSAGTSSPRKGASGFPHSQVLASAATRSAPTTTDE
ncbi:MAG: hypothetical protein AVDCRST_MAG77-5785 [uncultured Chloroflexi bacterium]|uniref:Uncharacterized protein n=1 Tax=uncultured Chloroflexota bacterium TaxID=166587 RepID=A0A6J4KEH6_9CHLR|nr:MAG: hypothetical protein AVDCRST_MAG77-5785 [uncultured Chloroflexota bacterium]